MSAKTQSHKHLRKGDKVVVITGNDKGRVGEILERRGDRVLVKGINVRKKAVRRTQANPQGGIIDMEVPIHASNVMLCHGDDQGVRVRVRETAEGEREVVYRVEGSETVHRKLKQVKK